MKIAGASTRKPDAVRDAIRAMDIDQLQAFVTKLDLSTKAEQSALHFARAELTRRRRNAHKAKAAPTSKEKT